MIDIKNLEVSVGEKQILKGVSLSFELGKNYCILGRNGSGKSTLSSVLMGHPKYEVTSGEIMFHTTPLPNPLLPGEGTNSVNLLEMETNERANAGIFLSFQNIPEIKGLRLSEYLRTIFSIAEKQKNAEFKDISPFLFKRYIKKHLDELHIDEIFLDRDLNVGFSGGEKRKIEILQMKLIGPKYIILDEIDSGLDLDAFKTVATMLQSLSSLENSIIIITHYFTILEYIPVDMVYVMQDGKVLKQGGKELAAEIQERGFEGI